MSLMEKLMLLSGTLWLSAIAFIVYAWILQSRQQVVLRYIASRLTSLEKLLKEKNDSPAPPPVASERLKTIKTPETTISIDKNEPLSKYESVQLPDEIDINFVDR